MTEILLEENNAKAILRQRRIERDICESRTTVQVVMDLAMKDIEVAFEVIEASHMNVGYNEANE